MTTLVEWHKVNGEQLAKVVKEATESLAGCDGEVLLDFSAVLRIDPAGLLAVEELADTAEKKSVKIVLRGVNVSIYKVMKLAGLAARFSFVD